MQAQRLVPHPESAVADGAEAVFHAHNVSKIYTMGEVKVQGLRSVTLDLYEGEFVVLLGAGNAKNRVLTGNLLADQHCVPGETCSRIWSGPSCESLIVAVDYFSLKWYGRRM
jgi:hypothetical protein